MVLLQRVAVNIEVEISDKWYTSRVGIGLALFNIIIGDMDSGID